MPSGYRTVHMPIHMVGLWWRWAFGYRQLPIGDLVRNLALRLGRAWEFHPFMMGAHQVPRVPWDLDGQHALAVFCTWLAPNGRSRDRSASAPLLVLGAALSSLVGR